MPNVRLVIATVLASGLVTACCSDKSHTSQASGPVVTASGGAAADVQTGSFESVELRGGGHVTLHYGTAERVRLLSGSTQYTQFHIEDGSKLVIDACNSDCPTHYDLDIEITMPRVAGVAISGGGHIETASGFPAQGSVAAAVQGGGDIDLRALDARNGTAAVDGGGKIRIHADDHLTAAVNGGGSIRYSGNAQVMQAIDGGGSVEQE